MSGSSRHRRHEQERHPLRCLHRNPREHAEPELDRVTTNGTGSTVAVGNGGINTASATSSGTSGFNGQQTLYVRQAWAYIGTDTAGIIRIGQGFSANALLETGLNDEFDAGGWDELEPLGF